MFKDKASQLYDARIKFTNVHINRVVIMKGDRRSRATSTTGSSKENIYLGNSIFLYTHVFGCVDVYEVNQSFLYCKIIIF